MKYAVEINKLNKIYKKSKHSPEKHALVDIDLVIPKGSIFGLLGPNGAGKSTIINIMAGLTVKSSGDVRVWGHDIQSDARSAKACIGVVPQELNFDPFFTPYQSLELQAGMYGVPKNERQSMKILEMVGLADKRDAYVRSLSGGMKRRLLVAKAMVHSPHILVLDEPTAGVDVELRRQLWQNVRALNSYGVTILLTTHYLEEAEELCDRIAIINNGQVVACEGKHTLLRRIDSKEIIFSLDREVVDIPDSLQSYCAVLKDPRTLSLRYHPKDSSAGYIISLVQEAGYGIVDITTKQSHLEDVFLQLVGS
ncbi:MAG: ABC transporter ATP-binding protein [Alphaproteobacteria bacterium]